ncbi:hypothetical protein DL767_004690 [Monosporascus sp. MG133]|nr:hypothetical protein DL767_004690 [Monosporascus sp. MG133]
MKLDNQLGKFMSARIGIGTCIGQRPEVPAGSGAAAGFGYLVGHVRPPLHHRGLSPRWSAGDLARLLSSSSSSAAAAAAIMASRCHACSQLSISKLVDPVAGRRDDDPWQSLYVDYHESLSSLEKAAAAGCDFCRLILDSLKTIKTRDAHVDVRVCQWWFPEMFARTPRSRSKTLYEDAKKAFGDPRIRLHITAHHLDEWDKEVEASAVLDAIIVQVGTAPMNGSESDLELDGNKSDTCYATWGLPPLVLTVSVPRDKRVSIAEYKIGRFQPDDNLGSSGNLADARRWLETCQKEHPKPCPGSEPSELPTRVVNVGTNAGGDAPRIEYSQGQKGSYVALSHCWGAKIDTLLTTQTEATFLQALPLDSLSANFRDAITITRELGIKYLWIDSLCILQDSKEDWEKESREMAAVYRDATLALFAIAASASTVGLAKPVRSSTGLAMRVFPSADKERNDEVILSVCNAPIESLRSLYNDGPLWSRAWTLQEGMLSPRGLYFGNKGVYWKCNAAHEATTGAAYGRNVPELEFEVLDVMIQDSAPNRRGAVRNRDPYSYKNPTDDNGRPSTWVLNEYYVLVCRYTQREITFGSDIFPAFSSLASTMHPNMGGDYVAGGWSVDLRRSLLWRVGTRAGFRSHATTASGDGGEEWRAPSWSWASAADPVVFGPYQSASEWDDVYTHVDRLKSDIKSYSVELADPQNPYGRIRAASLVIEALTIPVVRCADILDYDMRSYGDGWVGWDDEPITLTEAEDPPVFAFLQKADDGSKYLLVARTRQGDAYIRLRSDNNLKIKVKKSRSETYKAIMVSDKYGLVIAPVPGHPEEELINLTPRYEAEGKKGMKILASRFLRVIGSPFRLLRSCFVGKKAGDKPDMEGESLAEAEEEYGEEEEREEEEREEEEREEEERDDGDREAEEQEEGEREGEEGEEELEEEDEEEEEEEEAEEERENNWRESSWPLETFLLV